MFSNASSFSFFESKLKKLSIGWLRSDIENTCVFTFLMAFKVAAEFCTGHPSCKNERPSQCLVFLNTSEKSLHTIDANRLPSKRHWYWWHRTAPHPGDRATTKCAIRPPVPARLLLVVHKGFSPSDFLLQAIVSVERASSCGLCLCVNPVPSR